MKSLKYAITLIAMVLLVSISVQAQENMEDVIYLKNGNIYRGLVIEQVPGVSMKIQSIGGNVFTVAIADIMKITKEVKVGSGPESAPQGHGQYGHGPGGEYHHYEDHQMDHGGHMGMSHDHFYGMDSGFHSRPAFHYRKKGYFFQGQILVEAVQGGGRIINGYKFGPRGYLGVGIGVDMVYWTVNHGKDFTGTYLPLFLYYSGDFFKKKITPFYTIEAGYAMRYHGGSFRGFGNFGNTGNFGHMEGGVMGGVGLGVRFFSRHRANISISLNADAKSIRYREYYNTTDANGNLIAASRMNNALLLLPGFKVAFGF